MSSIKYIIGQYTRVNSFIRSLDRINEFTREYCPITYTYCEHYRKHDVLHVPVLVSGAKWDRVQPMHQMGIHMKLLKTIPCAALPSTGISPGQLFCQSTVTPTQLWVVLAY